jgi:hypothetical protein
VGWLLLLLMGCSTDEELGLTYVHLDALEPGRAGCDVTEGEDRDGNGFIDFERRTSYDDAGHAFEVHETETGNGGDDPIDPNTFRIDTVIDDRGHPQQREEGPDDTTSRTLTTWDWDYGRSALRHRADVDRRNNGEDLVLWTHEYNRDGRIEGWEMDATDTTGLVTKLSYLWEGDGVGEIRRFDSLTDGALTETARWSRENDSFGRVLRMVEIEDGVEGRAAVYTRDDRGRLRSQTGGWGALGEWSSAEVQLTSPCFD